MSAPLAWVLAGLVMLGGELVLPGAYLLWAGLAAVGTGFVLYATGAGFGVAVAAFVALLAAGIGASVALRSRAAARATAADPNAHGSGLVGRTGVALAFEGAEGRVRVGDSDWSAVLAGADVAPAPGDRVRVAGVRGIALVVEPLGGGGIGGPDAAPAEPGGAQSR